MLDSREKNADEAGYAITMSIGRRSGMWRRAAYLLPVILVCLGAYLFRDVWAASRLQANQQKWDALRITHYRYFLATACMCALRHGEYEVRDGKPLAHPYDSRSYFSAEYATVDGLFGYVQEIIDTTDAWVSVEYDPKYGYPKRVLVRSGRLGTDSSEELSIRDFEVLR